MARNSTVFNARTKKNLRGFDFFRSFRRQEYRSNHKQQNLAGPQKIGSCTNAASKTNTKNKLLCQKLVD
jgi:hypothetical protein